MSRTSLQFCHLSTVFLQETGSGQREYCHFYRFCSPRKPLTLNHNSLSSMKNILCLCLIILAASVFALSGCQSIATSNALPDDPRYQPVPERAPIFSGEYFKLLEVDKQPRSAGMRAEPAYPREFERMGISGEATITFLVTADGRTDQVQVIRATHGAFADAAMTAVRQWRFTPATKNGKPVNCLLVIPMAFNRVN